MAFGRSNSLSLNTGAVNSSFAAQQQSQPQQSGGLFGTTSSQPQQTGGIFGGTQTSQPQPTTSSVFGAQLQTSQPQNSGSTFGSSLSGQPNQNQQNTQQNSGTGGLGGSLFGNNQQNSQQQQPASSSLFGNSTFGNNQQSQQQNQQQTSGQSLFGTSSLFNTQHQPNNSMSQSQQPGGSIFGSLSNTQNTQRPPNPIAQQPSLLATARHNQSQYQPFVTGRLTLGQGSAPPQTSTGNPATKLSWDLCRPTTRFADLTDDAKKNLEMVEQLVREQEDLCRQIEAFVPSHESSVGTLAPDVRLVTEKLAEVEDSLSSDAHGVQLDKDLTVRDDKDLKRCERVIDNLGLPGSAQYPHTSSSSNPAWDREYDTDLINNYFHPLTSEMGRLVDVYNSNLAEIENHVGTIEQSTVLQAQGLRAQRGGLKRGGGGEANVRELAETLRGFEASILAAAGQVGAAREGVNELVVGRHGRALGVW